MAKGNTSPAGKLFLIFFIIVLLSLTITAYLFYKNKSNVPAPTSISSNNADWKTYNDSRGRFSFKYPSDIVNIDDFDDGSLTVFYNKDKSPSENSLLIFSIYSVKSSFPNDPKKDINGYITMYKNEGAKIELPLSQINIAGYEAFKFGATNIYRTGDIKYIYIPHKNENFVINYYFYSKEDEDKNSIFNQVLSTFKFTN